MKAYLFIETGEVRTPKEGEWFLNLYGNFVNKVDDISISSRDIFVYHAIEVPENALGMSLIWKTPHTELRRGHEYYPIPRKKKVKKTVGLRVTKVCGKNCYHVDEFYQGEGYPVEIEVEE